jgi:hypothetical protein
MRRQDPYKIIGKQNEYNVTTAHELMTNSGLDWTVSLTEVFAKGTEYGSYIEAPDKYATVRRDTDGTESVLSVVGSRYKVFQNSEIFS